MDKHEFSLKIEQLKKLIREEDYVTALRIVDSIDWNRVRNVNLLTMAATVLEKNDRLRDARSILNLALDRAPVGKRILFKLTELSVKLGDINQAEDYYYEYRRVDSSDIGNYLLQYMILKARHSPYERQLVPLELYCEADTDEKWMYELATVYDYAGRADDCVRICDKIALLFGGDSYTIKALRLKMRYAELTPEQKNMLYPRSSSGTARNANDAPDADAYGMPSDRGNAGNQYADDRYDGRGGENRKKDLYSEYGLMDEPDISTVQALRQEPVEEYESADDDLDMVKRRSEALAAARLFDEDAAFEAYAKDLEQRTADEQLMRERSAIDAGVAGIAADFTAAEVQAAQATQASYYDNVTGTQAAPRTSYSADPQQYDANADATRTMQAAYYENVTGTQAAASEPLNEAVRAEGLAPTMVSPATSNAEATTAMAANATAMASNAATLAASTPTAASSVSAASTLTAASSVSAASTPTVASSVSAVSTPTAASPVSAPATTTATSSVSAASGSGMAATSAMAASANAAMSTTSAMAASANAAMSTASVAENSAMSTASAAANSAMSTAAPAAAVAIGSSVSALKTGESAVGMTPMAHMDDGSIDGVISKPVPISREQTTTIGSVGAQQATTMGYGTAGAQQASPMGYDAAGAQQAAPMGYGAAGAQQAAPMGYGTAGTQQAAPMGYGAAGTQQAAPMGYGAAGAQQAAPMGYGAAGSQQAAPMGYDAAGSQQAAPMGYGAAGIQQAAPMNRMSQQPISRTTVPDAETGRQAVTGIPGVRTGAAYAKRTAEEAEASLAARRAQTQQEDYRQPVPISRTAAGREAYPQNAQAAPQKPVQGNTPAVKNHMIIEAHTDAEGLSIAIDELKRVHERIGIKNPVVKTSAAKLNDIGFTDSIVQKIRGKDLVIERAGDLDEDIIEDLYDFVSFDNSGTIVVLIDTPDGLDRIEDIRPEFFDICDYVSDIDEDDGGDEYDDEYVNEPASGRTEATAGRKEQPAARRSDEPASKRTDEPVASRTDKPTPGKRAAAPASQDRSGYNSYDDRYDDDRYDDEDSYDDGYDSDDDEAYEPEARKRSKGKVKQKFSNLKNAEPSSDTEQMEIDDFAAYCNQYATSIDCVINGKSMLALYERIELMEEEGVPLTKENAVNLIEEAADKAEKPPIGKRISGMFHSKYDKNGLLILKEDDFI